MNDVIGLPYEVFWGLMIWLGSLGLVILLLCMRPMTAAFLRTLKAQKAETKKAPQGPYSHLREQVERADRAARGF